MRDLLQRPEGRRVEGLVVDELLGDDAFPEDWDPFLSLRTEACRLRVVPCATLADADTLTDANVPLGPVLTLGPRGILCVELDLHGCGALDDGFVGLVRLALQLCLGEAEACGGRKLSGRTDASVVETIPTGFTLADGDAAALPGTP